MAERTGWDRRLSVAADGKGLIGHAGAVLLRACADRLGLTAGLGRVLPGGIGTWRDRAEVVVGLAVAITLGASNLSEAEQLQRHHVALFGPGASDSTARRTLLALDTRTLARIARVRARVRRHVWGLLHLRPGGFPWLTVAGKGAVGPSDRELTSSHSTDSTWAVTYSPDGRLLATAGQNGTVRLWPSRRRAPS